MNKPAKVALRGGSPWIRRLILACTALALLAAAWLLAWGLFLLGSSALVGGFLDATRGLTFWPATPRPATPLELANDARNAAELAGMYREGITMTAAGVVLLVSSLWIIRGVRRRRPRPQSKASDPVIDPLD